MNVDKKFRILIAPCSENERFWGEFGSFDEAYDAYIKMKNEDEMNEKLEGVFVYQYDTDSEANAFIDGYESGAGWIGDGFFISNRNPKAGSRRLNRVKSNKEELLLISTDLS